MPRQVPEAAACRRQSPAAASQGVAAEVEAPRLARSEARPLAAVLVGVMVETAQPEPLTLAVAVVAVVGFPVEQVTVQPEGLASSSFLSPRPTLQPSLAA